MQDTELLKGLIEILKNVKTLDDVADRRIFNGLKSIINEKWITIHPHGDAVDEDGKKDYRRLKLEDGETPADAIKRVYKTNSDTHSKLRESIRENVKQSYDKNKYLAELEKKSNKLWQDYSKALRQTDILWDDTEEVKAEKRSVIDKAHELYKDALDERNALARELNQMHKDLIASEKEAISKFGNIDIANKLKKADISETVKKLEQVFKEYDWKELVNKYDEIHDKFKAEKGKWLDYMNAGKDNEEKLAREKEYSDWFEHSDLRKERDKYQTKIMHYDKDRREAIAKALQIPNSSQFNIEVNKKSVLSKKIAETNELLSGIINKDYIPNFMPVAIGRKCRANATGNILFLESDDSVATQIHEVMHWLERTNPKMLANSRAFLEYRTKDDEEQKLSKLTNNKSYKSNEKAKQDNFFSPYCGKIYETSTEIMSMGVQRLFERPDDFYKNDREYFNFVIANLQGKL